MQNVATQPSPSLSSRATPPPMTSGICNLSDRGVEYVNDNPESAASTNVALGPAELGEGFSRLDDASSLARLSVDWHASLERGRPAERRSSASRGEGSPGALASTRD